MRRGAVVSLVLALLLLCSIVAADPGSEPPSARVSTWVSLRAGVVEAPYPSLTLGEVQSEAGQARLFRMGGAFQVAKNAWVGAYAAYVFGGIEQPAGSYRAIGVWGNPILYGRLSRSKLLKLVESAVDGDLALSLGVPVAAERGTPYEQLDRRALTLGNALEGMTDPELFTPNVLPAALSGTLALPLEMFRFRLGLELPLLVRLSDTTIPDGASSSAVGFVPNLEAHAAAWPWTWFGLSLGGMVAWPLVEPVYLRSRSSDPQATVVPRLLFALGGAVLITLEASIAAGGPASGTVSGALGVRLAL